MAKIKIYHSKGCKYCPDALSFTREIAKIFGIPLEEIDVTNDIATLVSDKIIGVPTAVLCNNGREIKRYEGLRKIINELVNDILKLEVEA